MTTYGVAAGATPATGPLTVPTSAPVALRVRGWGWRHAGRRAWAVRGLDLEVAPGERVLLLGPSGAGKSTLLAGVAGLLDPATAAEHEGDILLDGRPAAAARDRVGMLFQDPESALVMGRAGDDVAFGLENAAVPPALIWPRVDAALRLVGFPHGRAARTDTLSGGEQQRLALAGVLARSPGLLALDEPTANLDPAGTGLVREALARVLASTGATLLLVEHRLEHAVPLVDRVVVLEPGGGVVADGPPEEVFGTHGGTLAARGVWVPGAGAAARPAGRPPGPVLAHGEGLTLRYPGTPTPTIVDVDVEVRAGEVLAVTGPNGGGKTTLALLVAGLLRPDAGAARWTARPEPPLHRWRARDLARRIGTVFQDPEHQFLTGRVREELRVGPTRTGMAPAVASRRVEELLDRLRLRHLAEANPFTLSGGEKRRLSVGTALATAPDALVLDEPTFGQDARTWAELVALCAQLRDEGRGLVTVTHDEAFVSALADRTLRVGR